jgi:DNA polymerase-3 subunit delta
MIYVLYGTDSFSQTEALRTIKAELDADGTLSANTTILDAREVSPRDVFAACDTVSLFGGPRLVILRGALAQSAGASGRRARRKSAEPESEKGAWWALVDYAAHMPEQTSLVLVDGAAIDSDLLKALEPVARVQPTNLPQQRDVAGWIQTRARSKGISIDGRASSLLAELIGNNTWMLNSELDKLTAYGTGGPIGEAQVRLLVTDAREREGFLLADAVADGKAAAATRLLHDLLAKGRPPAVLLLTIENRYRRIAIAREMVDQGESGRSIGSSLRIDKPYPLERLLDQVSRYPMPRVFWALDRIAQADHDVKQGLCDDELSLELLVHDLCTPAASSRAA